MFSSWLYVFCVRICLFMASDFLHTHSDGCNFYSALRSKKLSRFFLMVFRLLRSQIDGRMSEVALWKGETLALFFSWFCFILHSRNRCTQVPLRFLKGRYFRYSFLCYCFAFWGRGEVRAFSVAGPAIHCEKRAGPEVFLYIAKKGERIHYLIVKFGWRLRDHRLEGPQGEAVEREVRECLLTPAGARARTGREGEDKELI